MMNTCSKCGLLKPINEYNKRTKVLVSGKKLSFLRKECKDCLKSYRRNYYENNKEQLILSSREYAIDNKQKVKKWQKEWYNRNRSQVLKKVEIRYSKIDRQLIQLYQAVYRETNKDRVNKLKQHWRIRNLEQYRKSQRKREQIVRDELRPRYVKQALKRYHGFDDSLCNDAEFIKLYTLIIHAKRSLKKERK